MSNEGTVQMILVGVDPHKRTHTAAAVDRRTGELIGELTVNAGEEGHARLLEWGPGVRYASVGGITLDEASRR